MATTKRTAKEDDGLDQLAQAVASGEVTITSVRVRACLHCARKGIEGTFKSAPTPNWMNRWICDKCGKKVSR